MIDKPREFFDPSKVVSTKKPNDCPDCARRVETYLKSIAEWQAYNQKLRADLDLAKQTLFAYANGCALVDPAKETLAKLESK